MLATIINAMSLDGDDLRTILTLALIRVSNLHNVDELGKRTQYHWVGHDHTADQSMCPGASLR